MAQPHGMKGTDMTDDTGTPAQEIDWKAKSREWEAKSKQNFTDLQAAQNDLAAAQSELATTKDELGKVTERVTELETANTQLGEKVQGFETAEAHRANVTKVAEETGIPAGILRGDTEDELRAHAEALKSVMPPSPVVPGQGKSPDDVSGDPNIEAVRGLFGGQ